MLSVYDGVSYKEYVYLNGMKVAVVEDGGISYIHNNYLGLPKVITDSSGAVLWEGDYKPFGEMYGVNGTLSNNIRFPGQYQNEESGYSYNYFRDYDPTIGRYLQSDPIGLNAGVNTYAYAGSNPILYIDPDGKFHYDRNTKNQIPDDLSKESLEKNGWVELPYSQSRYHKNGKDGKYNKKYISSDGRSEIVIDCHGQLVTDPSNMGTYNYFGPNYALGIPHFAADILPYLFLGNTKEDFLTTDRFEVTGQIIKEKTIEGAGVVKDKTIKGSKWAWSKITFWK